MHSILFTIDHGKLILGCLVLFFLSCKFLFAARKYQLLPSIPLPTERKSPYTKVTSIQIQDPAKPNKIQCYDPARMELLGEVPAFSTEQVLHSVQQAKQAQHQWKHTTFQQRRDVLQTIQHYIVTHQQDICIIAGKDSGKTNLDALLGEVLTTCEKIAYICKHGEKVLEREYRPTSLLTLHKEAFVEYAPVGVLGVIAPWNYPFHNFFNHIISGLFAGNAIVCKVSEYTSWSAMYFQKIVHEALRIHGHSTDVVQLITGFGDAGHALVTCPDVNKIIFTGSTKVGKIIMKSAAENLTPVVLELGGKDPMVLCEDCNLEQAVPIAMRGVFQNCGQNCCGVERLYVYKEIYTRFIDTVLEQVESLRQGMDDVNTPGTVDCGAMVMPQQLTIIQSLIDDAVTKGAKLLTGGYLKKNTDGLYYPPTILTDVTHEMQITKEEVFGPIMVVLQVKNDEHLLSMVNNCPFGLGSSVFSKNSNRAYQLSSQIQAGMATINDFGSNYLVQSLPFGGVKASGFGRFAGPEGLKACCAQKTVLKDKYSFLPTTIPPVLQYPIRPASFTFGTGLIQMAYASTLKDQFWGLVKLIRASMSKK